MTEQLREYKQLRLKAVDERDCGIFRDVAVHAADERSRRGGMERDERSADELEYAGA